MDFKTNANAAEIKSILTSLLISNPSRCTIQQLSKDFQSIEGRPVPYKNLGFNSLEEYLLSIPDVVKVYGTGAYAEVEGVITSKSQHINEMVLKQKKSKKKSRGPPRRIHNSKLSWYYNAAVKHSAPVTASSVENHNTPIQPKTSTGKQISFTISKSVKDECVNNTRTDSSKECGPVNFESLERKFVCVKEESSSSKNSLTGYSPVEVEYNSSSVTNFRSFTPSLNYIPTVDYVRYDPDLLKDLATKSNLLEETVNASIINSVRRIPESSHNYSHTDNSIKFSPLSFKNSETTNKEAHFSPVSVNNLESKNESLKEAVNFLKFNSVKELNKSHFNSKRNSSQQDESQDDYSDAAPANRCDILDDNLYSDDDMSNVPSTIRKNLKVLIKLFPEGIECSRLPEQYKKMFGRNLRYEKYDYKSLIEMCSDLPDIFRYVQESSHDYLLFDCSKPVDSLPEILPEKKVIEPIEIVASKHIVEELRNLTWDSESPLIPPDIIRLSDEIGRFFPADVAVGDIFDVCIGEIFDLSKFWMFMTYGDLNTLMSNLQSFYEKNKDYYEIPEQLLADGLYCVTLYGLDYHRSVIVNLLPQIKGFVRVLYIDYGTVANVATDKIWFLTKEFGNTPCQAIRARLSNIYPVYENRPWPQKAIVRFEKLVVEERVIVAEVTKVDEKDHILEVYLADITNEKNIFYINDVFVKEGLALYTDQKRKKGFVDYDCIPNVRFIHLYPQFCEIEAGLAPTTEEMKYIVANKVPLHHYMSQYFDIYYFEDLEDIQKHYEMVNRKKLPEVTIPISNSGYEFNLSFFPDCIRGIISDMCEEDKGCTGPEKIESGTSADSSFRGFCNKRLWLPGKSSESDNSETNCYNDSLRESILSNSVSPVSLSSCSQDDTKPLNSNLHQDVVSLNNSFQQISVTCSLSVNADAFVPRHSTNPFIDDCTPIETNPFRSKNPFITDIQETALSSEVLEIFAKPSDNKFPERIVNNLTDTHDCNKCSKTKQTNVEKVDAVVQPVVKEPSTTVGRVRTPPGFSSRGNPSNIPTQQNLQTSNIDTGYKEPYNQYQYYCRVPLGNQLDINPAFYPQNQLRAIMTQPYMNNYYMLRQVIPQNQYNFNLPTWRPVFTTEQSPYYHPPQFHRNTSNHDLGSGFRNPNPHPK